MKNKIDIQPGKKLPPTISVNWQQLVDTAASLFSLPAVLIKQTKKPYIEIFKASSNLDNPYEEGARELLAGLYCEKTIVKGGKLEIADALSEGWPVDNSDIELGMISYLGLPIYWPDGETFGTLCGLDKDKRFFTSLEKQVFFLIKKVLESDLLACFQQEELNKLLEKSEEEHKKILRSKKVLKEAEKTAHDKLKARVRELDCLHEISQFLADNNLELSEIMKRTVRLLPIYFKQAKTARFKIIFRGEEYKSQVDDSIPYDEFQVPLKARSEVAGHLSLHCCQIKEQLSGENLQSSDISPEEKNFLTTVGNELTRVIEKKDLEAQREADNRRLNSILNSLSANICVLNPAGEISNVNQSWLNFARNNGARMTEVTPGVNYLAICYQAKGEERGQALEFARGIEAVMEGKTDFFELEYSCHSSAKKRWFLGRVTPQAGSDKKDRRGVVIAHENITEQKKRQQQIKYLSFHDNLTGLYNSAFFEQELKRLDSNRKLPLTIMLADINGLEVINASYGRAKGDEILQQAAELLQNSLRREDIIARWGGDEFVLLLPRTDKERAQAIYERVKAQCELTSDNEIPLSLGLGYAIKKAPQKNTRDVIKEAEQDMQHNKLLESSSSKNKIIRNLLTILGTKSDETEEHAMRMINLAQKLGRRLNLPNHKLSDLALLASLHDIGKTFIPEDILKKPNKLNDDEWKIMQEHPAKGAEIAAACEEFAGIAEAIRAHHEKWDGSGYPDGLKGEGIPYLARVITIIDAFDVMTSERVYKSAITVEEALAEIKSCAGSQFDPDLAKIFAEVMEE